MLLFSINGPVEPAGPDVASRSFQGLPGPAGAAGEAGKAGERVSNTLCVSGMQSNDGECEQHTSKPPFVFS